MSKKPESTEKPKRKAGRPTAKTAADSEKPKKRRPGRPLEYTEQIASAVCDGLMEGKPMREICSKEGMPSQRTVLEWLTKVPEFTRLYARARGLWVQCEATELIRLADSCRGKSNEEVQAVRLMVDTRKWLFAKALPKVYGDHLSMDVQADVEVRQVDRMTMLDKAKAIHYALSKAKKLALPAPTVELDHPAVVNAELDHPAVASNAPVLATPVDHVTKLLNPAFAVPALPAAPDPEDDEVVI